MNGADITWQDLTAIGSLTVAIIVAIGAGLGYHAREDEKKRKAAADERAAQERVIEALRSDIAAVSVKLQLLEQPVMSLNAAYQRRLIEELTHFHEPRTDELLVKIGPPYMLSDVEERELLAALDKRIAESPAGMMPESEVDAARMLPMVIKRVKNEKLSEAQLVVVSLPSTVPSEGDTS